MAVFGLLSKRVKIPTHLPCCLIDDYQIRLLGESGRRICILTIFLGHVCKEIVQFMINFPMPSNVKIHQNSKVGKAPILVPIHVVSSQDGKNQSNGVEEVKRWIGSFSLDPYLTFSGQDGRAVSSPLHSDTNKVGVPRLRPRYVAGRQARGRQL